MEEIRVITPARKAPQHQHEAKAPWVVERRTLRINGQTVERVYLVQRSEVGLQLYVIGPFRSEVDAERHLHEEMQAKEDERSRFDHTRRAE